MPGSWSYQLADWNDPDLLSRLPNVSEFYANSRLVSLAAIAVATAAEVLAADDQFVQRNMHFLAMLVSALDDTVQVHDQRSVAVVKVTFAVQANFPDDWHRRQRHRGHAGMLNHTGVIRWYGTPEMLCG
jgi:hypothetical protein